MDRKQLRHTFIFSNKEHQRLIEALLLRCAEENNCSISSLIEAALIDYLVVRYPGSYPADRLLELRSANKKE